MIPALQAALFMPAVPSLVPIYKSTQTTTTNEDTTTWTDIDIGVPHPRRTVILAVYNGNGSGAVTTALVNGISPSAVRTTSAMYTAILSFLVPTGTTATISVTAAGSIRKIASVYVAYPTIPTFVSDASDTKSGTVDVTLALTALVSGFAIYVGAQNAISNGAFNTTWGGTDAVIEDVDVNNFESASGYTTGHINFTEYQAGATLTLAETVSGIKHLSVASFFGSY